MTADPTDETLAGLVGRAKTYIHTHSRDPALVEELVAAITSLAASRRAGIEEAVAAEHKRMMEWSAKRMKGRYAIFEREARAALAGDLGPLRTRIAMIDAGPMPIVLSAQPEGE